MSQQFNDFIFNAHEFDPAVVGQPQLPVSDERGHLCQIEKTEIVENSGKTGFMLVSTLRILEGAHTGETGAYRINIIHESGQAQEIAQRQLSALCHVTGVFNPQITKAGGAPALHGKPFRVVVGMQEKKKKEDPDRTEVRGVNDAAGYPPKRQQGAPGGQTVAAPQQAAAYAPPPTTAAPQGQPAYGYPQQPPAGQPQGYADQLPAFAGGGQTVAAPQQAAAPQQGYAQGNYAPPQSQPAWGGQK